MRNNLRRRWPKAFEEPEEERQWLAQFQRLEMSPKSPGGVGFLLFGWWGVGNIFNTLIKHVSFFTSLFQVASPWQSLPGCQCPRCSSWVPTAGVQELMCPRVGEVPINQVFTLRCWDRIQTASRGEVFSLACRQPEMGRPPSPCMFLSLLMYQRRMSVLSTLSWLPKRAAHPLSSNSGFPPVLSRH